MGENGEGKKSVDKHGLLEIHPIALCIIFDLDGVRDAVRKLLKVEN